MTYTLSKILVGSIGGSLGLLARGASQKKCSSSAHIGPPAFLAFSIRAFTFSESGFAGAATGGWATASAESMMKGKNLVSIRSPRRRLYTSPSEGGTNEDCRVVSFGVFVCGAAGWRRGISQSLLDVSPREQQHLGAAAGGAAEPSRPDHCRGAGVGQDARARRAAECRRAETRCRLSGHEWRADVARFGLVSRPCRRAAGY